MAVQGGTAKLEGKRRIIIAELRNYIGRVRRELVLEIKDILVQTTPVLTGHAQSNWIPSMGPPHVGVDGSREAVSTAAQERGVAEVREEPLSSTRVASLANNVPYIRALNEGSSQKAPEAFVESAIVQAKVNVRGRIGALRRAK